MKIETTRAAIKRMVDLAETVEVEQDGNTLLVRLWPCYTPDEGLEIERPGK